MAETILAGGPGDDLLDASGDTTSVVIRGGLGNDTIIGSDFGDRIDAGNGHNVEVGGAGNDSFFTNLSAARSDTIDGGGGHDTLTITMSAAQLATAAVHDALVALNTFETYTITTDPTAHFVNATLGLDLTGVEAVNLRVGGTVETLDAAGAHAVGPGAIGFEDLLLSSGFGPYLIVGPIPTPYKGFDWSSPNSPVVYSTSFYNGAFHAGPAAASGDIALGGDLNEESALVITKDGGGDFHFTQADVADLSNAGDFSGTSDITLTGTHGGTTVGTLTVHADETHWQTVTAAWGAIDTLTISWTQSGAPPHQDVAVLDNIWIG